MTKNSYKQFGFRTILITFGFCITAVIVAVSLFLFTRLYFLINDMEEKIRQYEVLNDTVNELQQAKVSFEDFFSEIKTNAVRTEESDESIKEASSVAAYHRYRALLDIKSLKADYAQSHEQYFLNRGIVNGIEYIGGLSSQIENDLYNITSDTYKPYYRALKAFDYLLDFTSNRYMSTAVKDNLATSLLSVRYITLLKYVSVLSLMLIMIGSSIAVFGITKYLNKNVIKMLSLADSITEENLDVPDIALSGPREFVELEDKLNDMKHRLSERFVLEKKLHRQELEQEKISKELEKTRYLSLQAQIDPHFLFNTLNVISHTALFENAPGTVKLINSLASVFRYRLEFKNEVTLADELKFVKEYLEIQKARFGTRLNYKIDCSEKLYDFVLPPFVVQPFVENALKHGIEPKETGGTVSIKIEQREQTICVLIEDDGVGIPEHFAIPQNFTDTKQHIGIANVVKRLAMYYNNNFSVSMNRINNMGGTRIEMILPVCQDRMEQDDE